MQIRVDADWGDIGRFLKRGHLPALAKASRMAGNRTMNGIRTEGSKRVREYRKLKARRVKDGMQILQAPSRKAAMQQQEWRMGISGKPVPLVDYGARPTQRGVSVNVSGRRQIVQGAFMATMGSGHTGVFRHAQDARKIMPGQRKPSGKTHTGKHPTTLPIEELYSSRISDVFENPGFMDGIHEYAQDRYRREFAHQADRAVGKAIERAKRKRR